MRSKFSFRSALVGGLVAGLLMAGVPVVASVGDAIVAGQNNSANQTTNLKGNAEFQNFKVTNTRATGVAARFVVEPGNPPFHVSSGVIVPKLNADRVDGVHAAGLLKKKDYDVDKDGIVDSADIKVRYSDNGGSFQMDLSLPTADKVRCVTDPVDLPETTTVIAAGGMNFDPLAASTSVVYGFVKWSNDGGTTWTNLNGVGLEAQLTGSDVDVAVPINAVNSLAAGTYIFAIEPLGPNLQAGNDFSGYCELTVTALTGLGASTDVINTAPGLDNADRADD